MPKPSTPAADSNTPADNGPAPHHKLLLLLGGIAGIGLIGLLVPSVALTKSVGP